MLPLRAEVDLAILGKAMYPTILLLFIGKIVGLTKLFKLGMTTYLEEGKLWIQTRPWRGMGFTRLFLSKKGYLCNSLTSKPDYRLSFYIWSINKIRTITSSLDHNGPGRNGNEEVFHRLLNSRRFLWCNGCHFWKWTHRPEFRPWSRLIVFHITLIPLRKVGIQQFSPSP